MIRVLRSEWLMLGLPLLFLSILLLRSSLRNFRTFDHCRIWSNVLLVFLPPIFLLFFLVSVAMAASKLR